MFLLLFREIILVFNFRDCPGIQDFRIVMFRNVVPLSKFFFFEILYNELRNSLDVMKLEVQMIKVIGGFTQ